MGRPKKCRRVENEPLVTLFHPLGVPHQVLEYVVLPVDELEVLRLADYLELPQEEVARRVQVSRPTVTRMLARGRRTLMDALINGKAIRIRGGTYQVSSEASRAKTPQDSEAA